MASLRKKLSMALSLNSEASSSASKISSMHQSKNSIDSGYHSMIAKPECGNPDSDSHAATFVTSGKEGSSESSPRKLHKAISSKFSGAMQAFSKTVRATTSYIYPSTDEPELPSSEWAECETPKKESRQSSLMSSLRSRKQRLTPRSSGTKTESSETQPSPVAVTQNELPALDVEIPNPSLNYEHLGKFSISSGSQLLAGVKLPPGPKNLWPGPTRLTIRQISGHDTRETPHDLVSKIDDPYVEQKDRLQHDLFITSSSKLDLELTPPESNKRYMSDDKGYLSEAESNAENSGADELSSAYVKHIASGPPESRTSLPSHHKKSAASHVHGASSAYPYEKTISSIPSTPLESEPSQPEHLDGTAEQTASLEPLDRRFSRQTSSLEDGLNALSSKHQPAIASKSNSFGRELPFDVYDADVETLESSMGSRAVWECNRADRDRRYKQIFHTAPDTESDKESSPELQLRRSPSRKPVYCAEEPVQIKASVEGSESAPVYPTSDLRYAIEAIERRAFPIDDLACEVEAAEKPALPTGDLAYAVEAIDRPSIATFEHLETVYQQRPMLRRLTDTVDERERLSPTPESTVTTKRLTGEEHMTLGAENVGGESIPQHSSESTDVSTNSSLKNQSHAAPENSYEAGIKAGSLSVPTYVSSSLPVGDDACLAVLRAAGASRPIDSPDAVQKHPVEDSWNEDSIHAVTESPPISKQTSRVTYRGKVKAGSTLTKQGSQNGTVFEHHRTVSGWTDNTDNSDATTPESSPSNAPPPFPSLLVPSEPARCIPNAFDALAIYGHDKIRIPGPSNAGIIHCLLSPFDCPDKQTNEVGLKSFPPALEGANTPEKCAQATSLEQYDLQGRSPGATSTIWTRSTSNTPLRTFNAAKLPSFGSPSPIASKKTRRNQNKSSNHTTNSTSQDSEPDFSLPKLESNKNSAFDRMPTSRFGSVRLAQGSAQKSSPDPSTGKKYHSSRDQASLEELAEIVGDSVRPSHFTSKSKSSDKNPCGEGEDPATLTSSPSRIELPGVAGAMSSDKLRDHAKRTINHPELRHELESFSINHLGSMNNVFSLHASRGLDGTSYAGRELDSVVQEKSPDDSYQHLKDDLQQQGDRKAESCPGGDETIGRDREPHKDAPHTRHQKKSSKPSPEAAKMFSVQRELEKRSDRACSRLAGKLKNGARTDVHVHADNSTHKDGRPPWRP